MEKRNSCLTIAQIRRHVNFGNNLQEAKQKKVGFYFVTLKWHRSTCYVNWAILIWDPVDVTTLLLYCHLRKSCISVASCRKASFSTAFMQICIKASYKLFFFPQVSM